ncbi:aquaporin [Rhodococcus sp. X156]|uniref:aquaporin n=1 Tax=Rhodococcus sp. X156 TaxID=2499145 RepID=UPI000FD9C130
MDPRKLFAELLGTALLVFFAVGVATLSLGFGLTGTSPSAGIVATALTFGLVLLVLVYSLGTISGCHVNPAVTIGFLAAGRIGITEAIGYWIAQFIGGIIGALVLWAMFEASPAYDRETVGLGADGFGAESLILVNGWGAFLAEVVLTFLFVLVVLTVTRRSAWPQLGGVAIGFALTTVHLIGIPITGTSVNPARSLGPALIVGGPALSQLWLFIVAPLIGGVIAALVTLFLFPDERRSAEATARETPGEHTRSAGTTAHDRGDSSPGATT